MFDNRADRDGSAVALESAQLPQLVAAPAAGLRDRLGLPGEMLDRALAQKVLQGWLQNRNQVLVPLTLRLGSLDAEDVALLMRFAATSLLATSEGDAEDCGLVRRWLGTIGADEAALLVFDHTLREPPALSTLLASLRARQLEAYGYAVAATAADLRTPTGRLYVDYLAARLALPADAVRSINRRYRR